MTLTFDQHAHSYQRMGAEHLWNSTNMGGSAMLWLSPGYGKTMIVLHAFKALWEAGMVQNMLVVAPLRVIQTVWEQEIEQWASLKGLVTCRLHGPKKETWLKRRDVNIWLINYEGLQWLSDMAKKGKLPFGFDVICFDEVRRMKNSQGKRFKACRPLTKMAKYRWGLTGTPASNGLMDLFGQFLIVDHGEALGTRLTKFRHEFFEKGYDGFTWLPRPGAQEAIEVRIEKYIFRAEGHLDLPEFLDDPRVITLDTKARKQYNILKNNLISEIEGVTITAANAAVLHGKLKQLANGRIYDEDRNVIIVHRAKQDALTELIEELGDEQLLIAYEFNHDLTAIREVLGEDIPYMGAGVNEATAMDNVNRWNAREIQFMAAHPASAGHGLNLQKGGAHHILWWGPTIDLDFLIQFNDRLRRQGNKAESVVVHTFVTEGTIDESNIADRDEKDTLQTALLNSLTAVFGDSITLDINPEEKVHMTDLNFKPDSAQGAVANPFAAGGAAPAAQAAPANPFAAGGAAPAQAAPAAEAAPAQAAPANPFATGATAAPAGNAPAADNPFAAAPAAQAGQQQAAIAASVAAPAQPTPETNPFAAAGGGQVVTDAEVVAETPPAQTAAPAATQTAPAEAAAPAAEAAAPAPAATDTGWQEPSAETVAMVAQSVASGFVPLNLAIPSEKYADVVAAIGRVLKK